jgi:hypothetical protein|tara:strand:- start:342 stop:533 length:192 start_codon:yes stop_codon:yes gene_type:complete
MNPQEMLGMVGGGNSKNNDKLEKYNIKMLREYGKKLKIKITQNKRYLSKEELIKKIKNKNKNN